MTTAVVAAPAGVPAAPPIVVGVIDAGPAGAALGYAFAEAERRGVALTVVATGRACADGDVSLRDQVRRWAAKYPGVDATLMERHGVDAVITLTAASRRAGLLVVQTPPEPRAAVAVSALVRSAHSAVRVVSESSAPGWMAAPGIRIRRARADRPVRRFNSTVRRPDSGVTWS